MVLVHIRRLSYRRKYIQMLLGNRTDFILIIILCYRYNNNNGPNTKILNYRFRYKEHGFTLQPKQCRYISSMEVYKIGKCVEEIKNLLLAAAGLHIIAYYHLNE